jgi:hypothetical protein
VLHAVITQLDGDALLVRSHTVRDVIHSFMRLAHVSRTHATVLVTIQQRYMLAMSAYSAPIRGASLKDIDAKLHAQRSRQSAIVLPLRFNALIWPLSAE